MFCKLLAQGLDIGLGSGKLLQEIHLLLRKLCGLLFLLLQLLPEIILLLFKLRGLLLLLLQCLL